MSTQAQRAAKARHDAKRPDPVSVRLSKAERAEIDAAALPGQGAGATLKRLAFERLRMAGR